MCVQCKDGTPAAAQAGVVHDDRVVKAQAAKEAAKEAAKDAAKVAAKEAA